MSQHKKVVIEVPHRISGFFEIMDKPSNIETSMDLLAKTGSRGGGPCLSGVGITTIIIDDDDKDYSKDNNIRIEINGMDHTTDADTTKSVIKWMNIPHIENKSIKIKHDFQLPIGAGYGSSGSGAIGTAVGLNLLFDLGMSLDQCGKIAHCAEVENKTGLGTVGGQILGGCTITMSPGYPFNLNKILIPPNLRIACASKGKILTSTILSDKQIRERIILSGRKAMKEIIKSFTIKNFMKVAIDFVENTGMLDIKELGLDDVKNAMHLLNNNENENIVGASMNQLGKSIYCIYQPDKDAESMIQEVLKENGFNDVNFLDFNDSGPTIKLLE
ncbi:MAG: GHMP family kinase ATP-binding protein [Promethearchaeota archaeon]